MVWAIALQEKSLTKNHFNPLTFNIFMMSIIPDESFEFYKRQLQPKRLPQQQENDLFDMAWSHQEAIVDGLLVLMYPLVQFLRLEMRVEQINPSRHVPKTLRPANRNSKMGSLERKAWVKLMQSAINHLLAGETEKLEEIKLEFRDLLLSDRDFNAYREIADFVPLRNTEWVSIDVVDKTIAELEQHFSAYHAIEDRLIPHVFAFARSQAKALQRSGQALDDYQQCALIGCVRAIRKFDPRRGMRFSTVAGAWTKGGLMRYINEVEPTISRDASFRNLQRDIKAMLSDMGLSWHDLAADEAIQRRIAQELQVPVLHIKRFLGANRSTASLHRSNDNGGEDEESFSSDVYNSVYSHTSSSSGEFGNDTIGSVDAGFLEERVCEQMKRFDPKSHYLVAMTMGIGISESAIRIIDSYIDSAVDAIENAEIVKPSKRRSPMRTRIISDTLVEDQTE